MKKSSHQEQTTGYSNAHSPVFINKVMKLCLTVLMGLPGSGKTTFAQTLKRDFENYNGKRFNFIHACYDELLSSLNYEELQDNEIKWKDCRTDVLSQIDLFLSSVTNNFESCPMYFKSQLNIDSPDTVIVILIDDNMYLRSMRYALFRKAKQYNIGYCQIYLKSSVEESNERNLLRVSDQIIPFDVICQMNGKIEVPKLTNKWEKFSLVFEANIDNFEIYREYFKMLNVAVENPECKESEDALIEKKKDMLICMTNVLHQCDIAIRHVIRGKIQKYKSQHGSRKHLKDYSARLSVQKGKILSEIRSGAIQVPFTVLAEIRENNTPDKNYLKLFMEDLFAD